MSQSFTPAPVKKGLSGGKIALIVVGAVLGVFLLLGVGCAVLVGGAASAVNESIESSAPVSVPESSDTEDTDTEPVDAEPADNSTLAQREALEAAQSYVESGHFSKAGLTEQLTSEYGEDFSKKDAAYAIANVDVDYNLEARQAAESYLESGHFSRASLTEQLTSEYGEGFTKKQAAQAVEHVGL